MGVVCPWNQGLSVLARQNIKGTFFLEDGEHQSQALLWLCLNHSCMSPEVHVDRVKQSMGKTGKTPLMRMAAAIEGSSSLMSKLEEYLSKSPMMLEKGHTVEALKVQTMQLPQSLDGITEMLSILKELPALQQGLRSGSTDSLMSEAKTKVQQMWHWVEQTHVDSSILQAMSSMLAESTLVFPLEAPLQQCLLKCGTKLKEVGEKGLVKNLAASCEAVRPVLGDLAGFAAAIGQVQDEATCIGLGTSQGDEELQKSIKNCLAAIMDFYVQSHLTEESVEIWGQAAEVAKLLGKFVSAHSNHYGWEQVEQTVVICRACLEVQKLEKKAEAGEEEALMKAAVALQRHLMNINLEAKEVTEHAIVDTIKLWHGESKTMVASVKEQVSSAKTHALNDELQRLIPLAAVGPGGDSWLSGVEVNATLAELIMRAKETLFRIKKKQLRVTMTAVKKVGHLDGWVYIKTLWIVKGAFCSERSVFLHDIDESNIAWNFFSGKHTTKRNKPWNM